MSKNTRQIALISHRKGNKSELPLALNTAEFGMTTDTNELFIGNSSNPVLQERMNADEPVFPYGNIQVLTEYSDNTKIITYRIGNNDEYLYYPIKLVGSKEVEDFSVSEDTYFYINGQTVTIPKNSQVQINDFDYLVIKYRWYDGRDLDTDTAIVNAPDITALNNVSVGWSRNTQAPVGSSLSDSVLYWASDNTGEASETNPQEENILISKNNLVATKYYDLLPTLVDVCLKGTWYSTVGTKPVEIEIVAYKGGTMSYNDYKFYNTDGKIVQLLGEDGLYHDSLTLEINNLSTTLHQYNTLANVYYNKLTGQAYLTIENYQGDEGSESVSATWSVDDVIGFINNDCTDVVASNNSNKIQLDSTASELIIKDGSSSSETSILDTLGLAEATVAAEKPVARTLYEVLNDRYSIKGFGVKGDGITDDTDAFANALKMLYGEKNDSNLAKELFFPAGTYMLNDAKLLLLTNTYLKGEGIDRTILKANTGTASLFYTGDRNQKACDETGYCSYATEYSQYPTNITIEDMTIDASESSLTSILKLGSVTHIIFNNVWFIGSENCEIAEVLADANIREITFNHCHFTGFSKTVQTKEDETTTSETVVNVYPKYGIRFSGNVDTFTIHNCYFDKIGSNAISLVDGEKFQTMGDIANCYFTDCGKDTNYVLDFGQFSSYINVSSCSFDKEVIEQTGTIKPYNMDLDLPKNKIDITNIKEDDRKILKHSFNHPVWGYIDYFCNSDGEEIVKCQYTVNDIQSGLIIEPGNSSNENTLTLSLTSNNGNTVIRGSKEGNIDLGAEADKDSGGEINVYKNLNLASSKIGNKNGNTVFDVSNGVLVVDDSNETPYSDRIKNNKDALTTVEYVDEVTNLYVKQRVNYKTVRDAEYKNPYDIVSFNATSYGDYVYLDRVSFNVRKPFYPMVEYIDSALDWKAGLQYYQGNICKHNGLYYVCTESHISSDWASEAESEEEDVNVWKQIYKTDTVGTIKDIRYVTFYAYNMVDEKIENMRVLFEPQRVDLQRRNVDEFYYPDIVFGNYYQVDDIRLYQDHYWKCLSANTPADEYDLHDNTKWRMIEETGYNYVFDFDKNMFKVDPTTHKIEELNEYVDEYNFSNYKIQIMFYDEDGNEIVPSVIDSKNYLSVNPAGLMNIRLHYKRG